MSYVRLTQAFLERVEDIVADRPRVFNTQRLLQELDELQALLEKWPSNFLSRSELIAPRSTFRDYFAAACPAAEAGMGYSVNCSFSLCPFYDTTRPRLLGRRYTMPHCELKWVYYVCLDDEHASFLSPPAVRSALLLTTVRRVISYASEWQT